MNEGFYRVREAPRWGGYSRADSMGRFESNVREIKTFNGQIGFLDARMLELRNPRKQKEVQMTAYFGDFYNGLVNTGGINSIPIEYPIPLIFRNEVVRARGTNPGFFVSFFKESEIQPIENAEAARILPAMVMRRYGDLSVMPTKMQRKVGEILASTDEIESLEEIPLYLPAISMQEIEARIESDRQLNRKNYDRRNAAFIAQGM